MKKKRIGEIVDIRKGQKIIEIENGEYNYISIENLHSKAYSNKTNCKGIKCDKDDILIAWDGANAGLTGVGFEGMIGSTLAKMSLKPDCVERVYPKYLYRYLDSKFDYIKSKRTGATIPHVNGNHLRNIEIPLPPLSQQKAIAAQLDKAQELVKYNEQLIEKYDELQQSLFLDMFGDPVINEKGWEVKELGEISIKKGEYGASSSAIPYDSNKPRYIRITDITNTGELNSEKVSPSGNDYEKYKLNNGDLLFARSGATVGKTYLHNNKNGLCVYAGYLIRFIVDNTIVNPNFAFHYTKTNFYFNWIESQKKTVAQPNINAQQFSNLLIPIPPLTLQNDFAQKIESVEIQKEQAKEALAKSKDIFQGLLQEHFF